MSSRSTRTARPPRASGRTARARSKTRGAGNPRANRTAGKRTAKPDKRILARGGSRRGAARVGSTTRAANEAGSTMERPSDFRRMATTNLKGHRSATDRKMQAKRDARNG